MPAADLWIGALAGFAGPVGGLGLMVGLGNPLGVGLGVVVGPGLVDGLGLGLGLVHFGFPSNDKKTAPLWP